MFRKGERVEIESRGTVHLGVVAKDQAATDVKVSVAFDALAKQDVVARQLRRSVAPLPVRLAKGDRAKTDHRGETLHGIVRSATATGITMVLDGGASEIKGHPSLFSASERPLPRDEPSAMDRWGVVSHKVSRALSEETVAFSATVTLDGKPVLHASNRGNGGCNSYHPLPGAPAGVARQLDADALAWAEHFGGTPPHMERADEWLSWHVQERPFGKTALAHFAEEARARGVDPGDEPGGPAGPAR